MIARLGLNRERPRGYTRRSVSLLLAIGALNHPHTTAFKTYLYADQSVPERFVGRNALNKPRGFKEKVVALTFDDGPDPRNTPKVEKYLAKYDAKATFFMIGEYASRHQNLVREVAEHGHVVGSHSWSHPAAPKKNVAGPEVWKTARTIYSATGVWPSIFRPPYGIQSSWTAKIARIEGYGVILWNRSGVDTVKGATANEIAYRVLKAGPGDIVLMHDGPGKQETVKAVPRILKALQKRGYRFVTVPDMLRRWDAFLAEKERKSKVPTRSAVSKSLSSTKTASSRSIVQSRTPKS